MGVDDLRRKEKLDIRLVGAIECVSGHSISLSLSQVENIFNVFYE
jgi:hypothetical protein